MLKNRLVYSLILCLFSFACSWAQGEKNVIPLKNILTQISQQHDVKFSYIEDEIVVFTLAEPEKKWSLAQKIDYLKKETKLQFKLIAKKYYSIFNNQKLDKPLCGFLLDAETDKGIENAILKIDKADIAIFTDANGYFELPKVSSANIQVQHQSYQGFTISPEDLYVEGCPKFKLQSVTQSLAEVITQRYLATGITKKNDGAIEVKPKKFGILPGLIEPDVLQTMQQVPGILSIDETISNINVRGGTHDQNLFFKENNVNPICVCSYFHRW